LNRAVRTSANLKIHPHYFQVEEGVLRSGTRATPAIETSLHTARRLDAEMRDENAATPAVTISDLSQNEHLLCLGIRRKYRSIPWSNCCGFVPLAKSAHEARD
jgi:hypothetical protein